MKKIFLFLMNILFFEKIQSTKFCINCKHYIPNKNIFLYPENSKYSYCRKFPYEDNSDYNYYLVNNDEKYNKIVENYYYCSLARKSNLMCGEEGKYYEEKLIF